MNTIIITVTIFMTGFLCLLNIIFVYFFRQRGNREVLSYVAAGLIELIVFCFALALHLSLLHSIPYHLPPGLPFNRAEIGATIALAIGLFPAAYWHRTSASELRARIAQDAKVIKEHDGGVHVRSNAPGEWMN